MTPLRQTGNSAPTWRSTLSRGESSVAKDRTFKTLRPNQGTLAGEVESHVLCPRALLSLFLRGIPEPLRRSLGTWQSARS
jgi:hypothetical protein